jgi:hypothetical protein
VGPNVKRPAGPCSLVISTLVGSQAGYAQGHWSWVVAGGLVECCDLGLRRGEADDESLDLSVPPVGLGLADAFSKVANDLDKSVSLATVDAQHRATDAGLSEMIFAATRRMTGSRA